MGDEKLYGQVGRKLFPVTGETGDLDGVARSRIEGEIIPSARADVANLLGIPDPDFDFSEPGTENSLFLAWCYYEWHDALDDFEANYGAQIARCREKWAVRQHAEEEGTPEL